MTQQSSTFSHICRLVPSDPPSHVHFYTENNTSPFFFLVKLVDLGEMHMLAYTIFFDQLVRP